MAAIVPSFADFEQLSQGATLVPVAKSVAADLLTPVSAFLAIAGKEDEAFLLESVERGEMVGRYTFLGARPYMRLVGRGQDLELTRGGRRKKHTGNVFQFVKQLLQAHRPARVPGLPPFTGGAVGFVAYDAVRQLESIGDTAADELGIADCMLLFFDRLLAFDHVRHQILIIAMADVSREPARQAYDRALRDIAALERKLGRRARQRARSVPVERMEVHTRTPKSEFLSNVNRVKQYITEGDVFQTVLSQRLDVEAGSDSLDVYRALRMINPSPYMYYLRTGGVHVLGSSPEMLVRVNQGRLEYRPIAGTHPRGGNEEEDRQLEEQMRADEKERAEHVMLVDLGRNDLGRVSVYGSVKVRDLMFVERYSHVMHLVSALEGRLRPELHALDALAACFPAGTLTGAPKVRAMQIIEELEKIRRGVYGGAVLYADFAGNLDSCIAIRTMVVKDGRAYIQAGAGIVADSDGEREYQECLNKAQALLKALELARHGLG